MTDELPNNNVPCSSILPSSPPRRPYSILEEGVGPDDGVHDTPSTTIMDAEVEWAASDAAKTSRAQHTEDQRKENCCASCSASEVKKVVTSIFYIGTIALIVWFILRDPDEHIKLSNHTETDLSKTPPPTSPPVDERWTELIEVLGMTEDPRMTDNSTPQYQAMEWLVYEDVRSYKHSTSEQRYALSVFYITTGRWTPFEGGWLTTSGIRSNECTWQGVQCDGSDIVKVLDLQFMGLKGSLPSELAMLKKLEKLDLSNNSISGEIPTELFELSHLWGVILGHNQLSSTLSPSMARLSNLVTLDLMDNHLSGTIPTQLGLLKRLRRLHLLGNDLVGTVPSYLGNLTNLEKLTLQFATLEGSMPYEVCMLRSMQLELLTADCLSSTLVCEYPACCSACY